MKFTRKQLIDYTYNSEPVISLYRSALAIGFWPDFPDYNIESLSCFLEDTNIDDTKIVDNLIIKNKKSLKLILENIYANRKSPWRVTPGFICKLALISNFPEIFTEDDLIEKGWSADIADIIISSARRIDNAATLSTDANGG